ncbi:MAG TPA: CDGSH iron-sulfur domain-containing protein [Ferruginibacter sp.]|nr:CDGSH iron-sulfur domain-containing protein [Ferruginibacter sp.]HMP20604.1 CDGSH iron-sulfur domain-containing protein [Ferruginibacter sp.]
MDFIPNEGLPKVAATEPACINTEPGKIYAWCTCGLSEKQPLCDGTHKKIQPEINAAGEAVMPYRSLKFQAETAEEVWLCQCKQTKTPPFCDGSHNKLKQQ